MVHSDGGDDGVEFLPLEFSLHPDEHPHVDVILHKLSDDIMFRWGRSGAARRQGLIG